ncbi:hypothetical protein AX289_16985 [Methylorubrum populi]|nr:hypothetical protein AX289_16985 [Methylorubrum populi]
MTRPGTAADLPLVSKEIKATFDVVVLRTREAQRITLRATVGVPYDEDGAARTDGIFDAEDFDGRTTLEYLRLGDGLYMRRAGLDCWQAPFEGLARELDVLHGASENRYLMPPTLRHGITGAKVGKWTTDAKGKVGDPHLAQIYDLSAVPARLEELRAAVAGKVLLTSQGLAYRQPYPSWVVSSEGDAVALTRPTRSAERPVRAFGLDRLDDALEMARRLGGDPRILGGVVHTPEDHGPDRSARNVALHLADELRKIFGPAVADLPDLDVHRWHDCANAEAILDASGGEGMGRVLSAARSLVRSYARDPGFKSLRWWWGAHAEVRSGLELGEGPAPLPDRPRP